MSKAREKELRKLIPVEEAIARWRKDPAYRKEHAALEEEFSLVAEIIKARAKAGLTQDELAKRMQTTQGAIARLESGATMPSTRTLQRFAVPVTVSGSASSRSIRDHRGPG